MSAPIGSNGAPVVLWPDQAGGAGAIETGWSLPPLWGKGGILFPNNVPPSTTNPLAGSPADPRSYTKDGSWFSFHWPWETDPTFGANVAVAIAGLLLIALGAAAFIWG